VPDPAIQLLRAASSRCIVLPGTHARCWPGACAGGYVSRSPDRRGWRGCCGCWRRCAWWRCVAACCCWLLAGTRRPPCFCPCRAGRVGSRAVGPAAGLEPGASATGSRAAPQQEAPQQQVAPKQEEAVAHAARQGAAVPGPRLASGEATTAEDGARRTAGAAAAAHGGRRQGRAAAASSRAACQMASVAAPAPTGSVHGRLPPWDAAGATDVGCACAAAHSRCLPAAHADDADWRCPRCAARP
jgi:hypothetical protein